MDMWPTAGHRADQFAAPIAGHWEAVGDCHWVAPQSHMTHPHLQVSSHYQKGFRYCPAWAAAHTLSPAREDVPEGTCIASGHPARGTWLITLCKGAYKFICVELVQNLKGRWSFFWYLAHALVGFSPTALFISDPNRKSPGRWTHWTGQLQGIYHYCTLFKSAERWGRAGLPLTHKLYVVTHSLQVPRAQSSPHSSLHC